MDTTTDWLVAITCHGNAYLRHFECPSFFLEISSAKYCHSTQFVRFEKRKWDITKEVLIAKSPVEWFDSLREQGAERIRLFDWDDNTDFFVDKSLVSKAEIHSNLLIEVLLPNQLSEFYAYRCRGQNPRVVYQLIAKQPTKPYPLRTLSEVKEDFKLSLKNIETFAKEGDRLNFAEIFQEARSILCDSTMSPRCHADVFIPGFLSVEEIALFEAVQRAWVFGGMGSWNDVINDADKSYRKVTDNLFRVIMEAIILVACSSGLEN